MKPSVARIVHFVGPDDVHHAAIICYVVDADAQTVNLAVWNEWGGQSQQNEVSFDPQAKMPRSWHWPEKIEDDAPQTPPNAGKRPSSAGDSLPKTDTGAV